MQGILQGSFALSEPGRLTPVAVAKRYRQFVVTMRERGIYALGIPLLFWMQRKGPCLHLSIHYEFSSDTCG